MRIWGVKKTDRFHILISIALGITALSFGGAPIVHAAVTAPNRYIRVSDPTPNAAATHQVGFDFTDLSTPVGSIVVEYCSNSPILGDACTAPAGFDRAGSSLAAQTGTTGFSVHPSSTANKFVLTRPAALPTNGAASYRFNTVINPSGLGTYYARIQTFTATDGTGLAIQEGGVALSTYGSLGVTTEVPPHLTFCAAVTIPGNDCSGANSFFLDLGELSKTNTNQTSSQLFAASNAQFGYSITVSGTTLTSGNNIVTGLASPAPSTPGTPQFGINLRANSNPSIGQDPIGPGTAAPTADYAIANQYKFVPGDSVVSGSTTQDYRKYTVSYIINVGANQAPGIYATTLTFICLANF